MQLFGLVNALLESTEECARLDLGIQRYSVVPLSTNSGPLSGCSVNTLHALVRGYRLPRTFFSTWSIGSCCTLHPTRRSCLLQKVSSSTPAVRVHGLYRVL